MARIVVCMPYYDRQYQLNKTLATMAQSKHTDFSVVIVDDCSPKDIVLPDLPFKVEVIKLWKKNWTNCAPVHNIAFNKALEYKPDIIIIQSPECYHVGDILEYADKNITDENYIAFGCYQINKEVTFSNHDINEVVKRYWRKVDGDPKGEGYNGWWNHPEVYPLPQYWCCAISANNLIKMNGIDERFAAGYAYEDGHFIEQIKKMGLRIDIVGDLFVVHQWHNREYPRDTMILVERNRKLYLYLMGLKDYRSYHYITPDLKWSGI